MKLLLRACMTTLNHLLYLQLIEGPERNIANYFQQDWIALVRESIHQQIETLICYHQLHVSIFFLKLKNVRLNNQQYIPANSSNQRRKPYLPLWLRLTNNAPSSFASRSFGKFSAMPTSIGTPNNKFRSGYRWFLMKT